MRMPQDIARLLACTTASVFHSSAAAAAADAPAGTVAGHVHFDAPRASLGGSAAETETAGGTGSSGVMKDSAANLPCPGLVWTFAYGANIGEAKLQAGGIHPAATLPAVLPGHALVFDPRLGADGRLGGRGRFAEAEHAFANVRKAAAGESLTPVRGVVHAVTEEELGTLDKSEAPIMHRKLIPVRLEGKTATFTVPAWTYVSQDYDAADRPDVSVLRTEPFAERAPSERYARLVLCGVEEQAIPKAYARQLREHLLHLGLPARSLDCGQPLQPLLAHGSKELGGVRTVASLPVPVTGRVSVMGSGMLTPHAAARKSPAVQAAMDAFLFPNTPTLKPVR